MRGTEPEAAQLNIVIEVYYITGDIAVGAYTLCDDTYRSIASEVSSGHSFHHSVLVDYSFFVPILVFGRAYSSVSVR